MKAGLLSVLFAGSLSTLLAGDVTEIEIKPGPTVMSAAEKAIVADVGKGIQHGVILIEETDRNDDKGGMSEVVYRMRAKILSPEGRSLADIAVPVDRGRSDLKTWWGRTILPDDRVLELHESQLTVQSIAKSSYGEALELRGALPGVVPGCVIEYGYVLRLDDFYVSTRVFLQQEWPVRALRYRWVPSRYSPAAYVLSRAEGLPITAKFDNRSVLVTARDLDSAPAEPHMPPLNEARASATFYYTNNEKAQEFWETEGRRVDRGLKGFLGNNASAREVVASLPVPTTASTEERLRAAYAWLDANVKNTMLKSAEEVEADDDEDDITYNAKTVLKAKEASPRQLDFLFAGMARAMGCNADIVFAVDRTDRFWNKAHKSMSQFAYTFVAVHAPTEPADRIVFVDAGSGLPYGQIPWRATGADGMLCSAKGGTPILIPAASPLVNRADTTVKLSFSDENESMLATWDRTSQGAGGLEHRRWLRGLDTRERRETLDRLCGESGSIEVSSAELPGLDDLTAPFKIRCELERSDMNISALTGRYSLSLMGPWWPETPEFTADARVHPVIFDYPKVDVTAIDVSPPHGFKPGAAPVPLKIESPYGRYELVVSQTPTGFHMDRALALTVLIVKQKDYEPMRKFFDDVQRADRTTVTFQRLEGEE